MKQTKHTIATICLIISLTQSLWPDAAAQRATAQTADRTASASTASTMREARVLFEGKCATCHGKDGRAKTFKAKFNKARDLTDAAWQAEASDERIYNSIANGRGKMPAFAKKFSREEIEALASHVRSLKK